MIFYKNNTWDAQFIEQYDPVIVQETYLKYIYFVQQFMAILNLKASAIQYSDLERLVFKHNFLDYYYLHVLLYFLFQRFFLSNVGMSM